MCRLTIDGLSTTPGTVSHLEVLPPHQCRVHCFYQGHQVYLQVSVQGCHDRTTMEFGTCRDVIKQYLDACYVSNCEAHWHFHVFAMQEHHPAFVCLQGHVPDQQSVVFNPKGGVNAHKVLASHANRDITHTGWFRANAESDANHDILHQDVPSRMVQSKKTHKWTPRK